MNLEKQKKKDRQLTQGSPFYLFVQIRRNVLESVCIRTFLLTVHSDCVSSLTFLIFYHKVRSKLRTVLS